jgi:WD40 repeat protein
VLAYKPNGYTQHLDNLLSLAGVGMQKFLETSGASNGADMAISPIFCDACGTENRAQAGYCYACGTSLLFNRRPNNPITNANNILPPQHMIKQRYQILAHIGKGGFGAVYRAADLQSPYRQIAIKEMSQQNLSQKETIEATGAFQNEALLLSTLTHPHLPRIYEQFAEAGRWYLVMDFIDGETLEDYLMKVVGGKLTVDKALSVGLQLCNVLEYLHSCHPPVIFRDLKPANIMLTPMGQIFLIDFGIARHFKPGQHKDTAALGSAGYAAPEQYGKTQSTPRTDIYALGATLHELLTGINPADNPFQFGPLNLPTHPAHRELEQLIYMMVQVDITKRPPSVAIVRQALENVVAIKAAMPTDTQAQLTAVTNGKRGGYILRQSQVHIPAQRRGITVAHSAVTPQPLSNTRFIGQRHTSHVTAVAWSTRGSRIASASYDKTVRIWDAIDGNNLLIYQGHWDRVLSVAWSPDSSLLASAGNDGTVQIWDPLTGNLNLTYREHTFPVLALSWSPDGKRVASACEDRTVLIWDTISGQTLHAYRGNNHRILAVGWSPNGKQLASAGEDKLVHVWTMQREKTNFLTSWLFHSRGKFTYRGHTGRINALAWSPDGQRIASAGADKSLQVWDVTAGRKYFVYRHPSATINCVAWSYDGRYLAMGASDRLIQVWDTITRNLVTTYAGHTGNITAVSWSPDGKFIASSSVDHTLHVWKVLFS